MKKKTIVPLIVFLVGICLLSVFTYNTNVQIQKDRRTIAKLNAVTYGQRIENDIENGNISFEDAAKKHSTCPSGQKGGDLGEFGRGQMVKEFEDATFSAEIGKIVGPVKTQFGYHLIKVEKRSDAGAASFDEVKESIRKMLMQQKQQEVYNAKVEELKAKYCK